MSKRPFRDTSTSGGGDGTTTDNKVVIDLVSSSSDEEEGEGCEIISTCHVVKKQREHNDKASYGFYLTMVKNHFSSSKSQAPWEVQISDLFSDLPISSTILLTSYMFDIQWLVSQVPTLSQMPNLHIIHGHREGESTNVLKAQVTSLLHKSASLVRPFLPIRFGTHHTKMMVMFYPNGIRVVVTTANFLQTDWEDKTQGVWVQDFPLKTSSTTKPNDFETELKSYLKIVIGKKTTVNLLGQYDFSAANVSLVASIPGYHKAGDMNKYGHLRLRHLLKDIGAGKRKLVYQYSSMGSLTEKWLFEEFSKSARLALPISASNLSIVWPTEEDVRNSNQGWAAGGSIPCTTKNMKHFIKPFLHRWNPPKELPQDAMPHIKTYASCVNNSLEWVLLTSSNLSTAAWGALQKNNSQFMIRSYELGVLFKAPSSSSSLRSNKSFSCTPTHRVLGNTSSSGGFVSSSFPSIGNLVFPLPYELPPSSSSRYTQGDVPWVWDKPRVKPDRFGNMMLSA